MDLRCSKCKEIKPSTEFSPQPSNGVRKHHSWCKRCCTENTKRWREKNPDKHKTNLQQQKVNAKYRSYGITEWEFLDLLELQDNKCAICHTEFADEKNTRIDHCHITGVVRGILCTKCNIGLGFFKDSVDLIEKALQYLTRFV